jgi:hypothetical protein
MYLCISQQKSEMGLNHPKHGGHHEEFPLASERKAAM